MCYNQLNRLCEQSLCFNQDLDTGEDSKQNLDIFMSVKYLWDVSVLPVSGQNALSLENLGGILRGELS